MIDGVEVATDTPVANLTNTTFGDRCTIKTMVNSLFGTPNCNDIISSLSYPKMTEFK